MKIHLYLNKNFIILVFALLPLASVAQTPLQIEGNRWSGEGIIGHYKFQFEERREIEAAIESAQSDLKLAGCQGVENLGLVRRNEYFYLTRVEATKVTCPQQVKVTFTQRGRLSSWDYYTNLPRKPKPDPECAAYSNSGKHYRVAISSKQTPYPSHANKAKDDLLALLSSHYRCTGPYLAVGALMEYHTVEAEYPICCTHRLSVDVRYGGIYEDPRVSVDDLDKPAAKPATNSRPLAIQ